jgi:hypothetical protein
MASLLGLLAEGHHRSLSLLAERLERDFLGLSAAARCAYRERLITHHMAKKLYRLDAAFAVSRHLTTQRLRVFTRDLESMLCQDHDGMITASGSISDGDSALSFPASSLTSSAASPSILVKPKLVLDLLAPQVFDIFEDHDHVLKVDLAQDDSDQECATLSGDEVKTVVAQPRAGKGRGSSRADFTKAAAAESTAEPRAIVHAGASAEVSGARGPRLRAAVLGMLHENSEIPGGLAVSAIAAKLRVAEAVVRIEVYGLLEAAEVFETIDGDHFAV